ncbi:hypothetical protein [Prosthecochloris sp.]|uniref:hypothetical protein n=1 Tax=Prosthecochloris sp. TaxID=290513 RepID=UPI00257F661E|nr:hypothetical protein [Prosthecochloris sp.]
MNTTKLHIIAKTLKNEMARTGSVNLLGTVVQTLEREVNDPRQQQQQLQNQRSEALKTLYTRLKESPVDNYSPAWRDALEEIGVSDQFGAILEKRVRGIFERNKITLQSALEELKQLRAKIASTQSNLETLVSSLEYFSVGEDELGKDECEVGVVIPRKYVKGNLKEFGSELVELEKTLLVFSELATGQREPLEIRQISSSELSIFLDYLPEIGLCIAVSIERIVALYKQVLEIKKLKKELVKQKVPERHLKGIEEHAASLVAPEIKVLAKELIENYGDHLEQGRKKEVLTELQFSLNKLANRIDRGFNIELRVSTTESDEKKNEKSQSNSSVKKRIMKSAAKIEYLDQINEPVLYLPEKNEESDENGKS